MHALFSHQIMHNNTFYKIKLLMRLRIIMYGLVSKRYKNMSQCLFVPFSLMGKAIYVGPSMIWC